MERAEEEGRVVLTRDQTFIQAGYTYQAYLVSSLAGGIAYAQHGQAQKARAIKGFAGGCM